MREITLEELLEAGCHFGHQVTRQNPKARDFIFEARDNIHVIDLAKTKQGLEEAATFVKTTAAKGGSMIVVGTKRQAQTIVAEEVKRARSATTSTNPVPSENIYYVNSRWIGGTLTNFNEVTKNYQKLKDLESNLEDDEMKARYTKKEIGDWEKSRQKLEIFYGGIKDMKQLPTVVFIVDTHFEDLAVKETLNMAIPTIGIVDTNADPLIIDHPIPANDDAVGSVKLIVTYITDAWIEGRGEYKKSKEQEAKKPAEDKVKESKAKEKSPEPAKNEKPKGKKAAIKEKTKKSKTKSKK